MVGIALLRNGGFAVRRNLARSKLDVEAAGPGSGQLMSVKVTPYLADHVRERTFGAAIAASIGIRMYRVAGPDDDMTTVSNGRKDRRKLFSHDPRSERRSNSTVPRATSSPAGP